MRHAVLAFLGVVVAVSIVGLSAQAPDPALGTWKLNLVKSKYNPPSGAPKSQTNKLEASEGGRRAITDGIDAQGKPIHTEISYKLDGKDYPLVGAPDANTTRVYKRIDDRSYEYVTKVGGKATTSTKIALSADGKTRTITTTGKNA